MLRQLLLSFEDLIFPQYCVKCTRPISDPEIFICEGCLTQFERSGLENWVQKLTCNDYLDFAFSPYWFDDLMNRCIHRAKYNHSLRLLNNIVGTTNEILIPLVENMGIEVLIPVPLYSVKKRERGYNQSEIIANCMSEFLKIPINTCMIKRVRWTTSQTKLNLQERNNNIRHAFKAIGKTPIKRIAVIDDVLTTGSTTNECARILKQNGAEVVGVISLTTPKMRVENPD